MLDALTRWMPDVTPESYRYTTREWKMEPELENSIANFYNVSISNAEGLREVYNRVLIKLVAGFYDNNIKGALSRSLMSENDRFCNQQMSSCICTFACVEVIFLFCLLLGAEIGISVLYAIMGGFVLGRGLRSLMKKLFFPDGFLCSSWSFVSHPFLFSIGLCVLVSLILLMIFNQVQVK